MHPELERQLRALPGNHSRILVGCPLAALGTVALGMIVANFVLHGTDVNTALMRAAVALLGGVAVVGLTIRTAVRGLAKDGDEAQPIIDVWMEDHATWLQYFLYKTRNWLVTPLTHSAAIAPLALLIVDWLFGTRYYENNGIFMILAIFALLLITFVSSLHHPLLCGPPDGQDTEAGAAP